MTTTDALRAIIADSRGGRMTPRSYAQVHRALLSLGLSTVEVIEIEQYLEYRRPQDGSLYPFLTRPKASAQTPRPRS